MRALEYGGEERDIFIFDIWLESKVAITLFLLIDLLCYRSQANGNEKRRERMREREGVRRDTRR